MKQRGFTVIELITVTAFLIFAGVLFFIQKNHLEVKNRDEQRKTAINAMYYSLENGFYAKNKYYPSKINETTLPTMDADLLTDPNGIKIGQNTMTDDSGQAVVVQSDYKYEPTNCSDDKCKSYTLHATLEGEAEYTKTSKHS
jgi:Tfp pilus assembly protein PilE